MPVNILKPHVSDILDANELKQLVNDGLITVQKHPSMNLWIYNYAKIASYTFKSPKNWPNAALQCRGLILDEDDNIIARPFPKFFNMGEHSRSDIMWTKPFTVYDKVDGSLGIMYPILDPPQHGYHRYAIATRGSFTSDQAIKATHILWDKYGELVNDLNGYDHYYTLDGTTYSQTTALFEIIYPENRIVCDYKGTEDLVLLAVLDNTTGQDVDPNPANPWPTVHQYPVADFRPKDVLEQLGVDDGSLEGFVLRFEYPKGRYTRVKVKYDEYVRLHRIVTGVSTKTVWKHLRDGLDFNELLDRVPDEFNEWLQATIEKYLIAFTDLRQWGLDYVETARRELGGNPLKSEFAAYVKQNDAPHRLLIFCLFEGWDNKADAYIWKTLEPEYAKPFHKDIDNG